MFKSFLLVFIGVCSFDGLIKKFPFVVDILFFSQGRSPLPASKRWDAGNGCLAVAQSAQRHGRMGTLFRIGFW